jgi:hypothetical protein
MKKFSFVVLSFLLLTPLFLVSANATNYVRFTGKLSNYAGEFLKPPTTVIVNGISSPINSEGVYEIYFPSSEKAKLTFVVYQEGYGDTNEGVISTKIEDVVFSNWSSEVSGNSDQVINFKLPKPINVNLTIQDAQGISIPNSWIIQADGNQAHNPYSDVEGRIWTGIQRWNGSITRWTSPTGSFSFWMYSTENHRGVTFGKDKNTTYSSPSFAIESSKSLKLCVPINFGSSRVLPSDCYSEVSVADKAAELKAKQEAEARAAAELIAKQEAEARAAAELKAKQEADAKAAAELKAKQEADAKAAAELKAKQEADAKAAAELKAAADKAAGEKIIRDAKAEAARILAAAKAAAAKKKITITCIKGKLIKKVTAVKPVCPAGYKKK